MEKQFKILTKIHPNLFFSGKILNYISNLFQYSSENNLRNLNLKYEYTKNTKYQTISYMQDKKNRMPKNQTSH